MDAPIEKAAVEEGARPARPTRRTATAFYLGRRKYGPIHELQASLQAAVIRGELSDVVLLLEHEPVVTLGRSAKQANVLFSRASLEQRGVDLEETGRGGDVTFHGPGQLVGYPIVDLRPDRCDLRRYVARLAEVMVLIARDHNVEAGTVDGLIGVWADAEEPTRWATAPWAARLSKIGAIGVRVSRWVTMHGFALNLDVDLGQFGLIVPCGISAHPVTSLRELAGGTPGVKTVAMNLDRHLAWALDQPVSPVTDLSQLSTSELFHSIAAAAPAPAKNPTAELVP